MCASVQSLALYGCVCGGLMTSAAAVRPWRVARTGRVRVSTVRGSSPQTHRCARCACRVHFGADAGQLGAVSPADSMPLFSGLSGEHPANSNAHLSSMLMGNGGLRPSAATSSDLGSFGYGGGDSLPGSTPAGSIELAV